MTKAIGALMVAGCPAALVASSQGYLTLGQGIAIGLISMVLGFVLIITDS